MSAVRLGRLYLPLLLISGGQAQAQDVAANWFPVHVGNKWLYEHETRDETGEGRDHLEIHSWKTEETIFGSWTIPEGTLVGRQVRVIEGSLRKGYRVDSDPAYLIRRDCLYRLRGVDWEPAARQLTPDFLKWLGDGEISADLCFPLAVHKKWGAPHWGVRPASEANDWD